MTEGLVAPPPPMGFPFPLLSNQPKFLTRARFTASAVHSPKRKGKAAMLWAESLGRCWAHMQVRIAGTAGVKLFFRPFQFRDLTPMFCPCPALNRLHLFALSNTSAPPGGGTPLLQPCCTDWPSTPGQEQLHYPTLQGSHCGCQVSAVTPGSSGKNGEVGWVAGQSA